MKSARTQWSVLRDVARLHRRRVQGCADWEWAAAIPPNEAIVAIQRRIGPDWNVHFFGHQLTTEQAERKKIQQGDVLRL